MLSTLIAVLTFAGLLMPGFVVAELSRVGRASRGQSDLELVLRALFYALAIHAVASPWTAYLVRRIDGGEDWTAHLELVVPYVAVVLVLGPAVVGYGLNRWLRAAEEGRGLGFRHAALGARDDRDAFDYACAKLGGKGRFVLLQIKGRDGPVAGKFGDRSWVGRAPHEHDLYLERVHSVSEGGNVGPPLEPPHGIWVSAGALETMVVTEPVEREE